MMNLGIIGAGSVVEQYHLPVLAGVPELAIAWLCDLNRERALALASDYGIGRVYTRLEDCPDVDAVLLATPVGSRPALMHQLVERRWHALCEKPFATSVAQHQSFLDAAAGAGLHLGVGFQRRYYWSTQTAARLMAAELLGPLRAVLAGSGGRVRKTGRDGDWYQNDPRASGGGVLAETGSHLIDQVMTILRPHRFSLQTCRQRCHAGLEIDTVARCQLEWASGKQASWSLHVSMAKDCYNGIVLACERGELRVGLAPDSPVEFRSHSGEKLQSFAAPVPTPAATYAAYREEWRSFGAKALGPAPTANAAADTGLATTALIADCYASAAVPVAAGGGR